MSKNKASAKKPVSQTPLSQLRADQEISAELLGQSLNFKTTWGLFSPREIDRGTLLLLKYLELEADFDCLDLGCGYGALGLTLAKLAPAGKTTLVDKDFVAIDYSKRNAQLNSITNVDVFLSNGFSSVEKRNFDLIVTNLPAKSGKELYYLFFHDAFACLKPGGKFYVVSITGLRKFIEKAFREIFGNYDKLKQANDYTVACGTKN